MMQCIPRVWCTDSGYLCKGFLTLVHVWKFAFQCLHLISQCRDSRSQCRDSRSQYMVYRSQCMDSRSQSMDFRSQCMDSRSQCMDFRSQKIGSGSQFGFKIRRPFGSLSELSTCFSEMIYVKALTAHFHFKSSIVMFAIK